MKLRLVLLVILLGVVSVCAAQTTNLYIGGTNPTQALPGDDKPVLMMWLTNEKCYECNASYAVWCSPGHEGCGVPYKGVLHYGWYKTALEAIKDAEDNNFESVSIFDTKPVPIERTEEEKHEPQPDNVKKIRHYKLAANK
jgi:hypothetical protein